MNKESKKIVKVKYESMSPKQLEDSKIEPYKTSFMQAIEDPSVKNIAITGKYGAGKSTILRSIVSSIESREINWCQKERKKVLWLSLACFSNNDEVKNDDPLWKSIEKSLVQQMLYIPANKDLPKSRYYKIEPASKIQNIINCIVGVIWTISFILLIGLGGINKKVFDILNVSGNVKHWILMIEIFLFLLSMMYVLWNLFRYASDKFQISKLSVGKSEFEINKNRSEFNKYFDEILYFFLQKQYSIVIFEDIDRFDDINVFEHLRELNNLLNNNEKLQEIYRKKENLYPIKFVYAVRDDIFSSISNDENGNESKNTSNIAELNTKFFDWIIPIIPFMSISNSAQYLLHRFHDSNNKQFKSFLREISIYCEDVRTWVSTINEFKLYQDLLGKMEDYNPQQLFSILFFKNEYPLEFGEFIKAKGSLYQILYTNIYYDKLIDSLEKDLEVAKDEYSQIKNMDEQWVVSYFKSNLFNEGYNSNYYIKNKNGKGLALNDITFDKLQGLYNKSIVDKKDITVSTNNFSSYNDETIPFDDFFKKSAQLDPTLVFSTNNSKHYTFDENLKNSVIKIGQIKNSITNIERKSIIELMKSDSDNIIDEILEYDENCKNYLRFALSEGYIDETANFYLVTIDSSLISEKDLLLIRKLRSGAPIKFDTEIDDIEKFISNLNNNDLNKPGIKLASIIHFGMYSDSPSRKVKKVYLKAIESICNRNNTDYDENINYLLEHYISDTSADNPNIKIDLDLPQAKKKMLKDFSEQQEFNWHINDEHIKSYLYEFLLEYLDIDDLEKICSSISDFIKYINEGKLNVSEKYEANRNNVEKILLKKEILIVAIKCNDFKINSNYIEYIVEKNKIKINRETMPKIMSVYTNDETKELSYNLVIKINNNNLQQFVDKNINAFVDTELEYSDNNQLAESKKSLILLLNNDDLKDDLKEKLIGKYKNDDLDFEKVPKQFANLIFNENKYSFSWTNLEFIENEDSFDENELTKFVSSSKDFEKMEALPSDTQFIRKAVNICSIKITNENERIIKLVNDYDGYNQDTDTLNKMIKLNLVRLSDELIESPALAITENGFIYLSVNKITGEGMELSDTEQKLINKLKLRDCLKVLETSDISYKLKYSVLNRISNEYLNDLGNDLKDDQKILVATKFLENYKQFGSSYLSMLKSLDTEKAGNYKLMIDLMNLTSINNYLELNLITPYEIQNHARARLTITNFQYDEQILEKLYDMEIIGKHSFDGQKWTINRKKLRKDKL